MPKGLSNSPTTFMRMMLSIFGDENLLCYLDDLMVFAPSERLALERLEMVFSRLKTHLSWLPRNAISGKAQLGFWGT